MEDRNALFALILLVISGLTRIWRKNHPRKYFFVQVLVFLALTGLLLADNIVPYGASDVHAYSLPRRVLVQGLEIAWWLVGAWLARAFMRAFVTFGAKPRESILIQELLGALVYMAALVAIFSYVLDLPIRGLLATSGALAIIIGLALQSTLGDAFSGIVMNLERPYRVGDWISVDSSVQGHVIETNWRATHIRTSSNDMAIVPNSIIAKSKIVNFSEPGQRHSTSVSVRLDRCIGPDLGNDLLREVLLGHTKGASAAEHSVTITGISAEAINFELGFSVADITQVDQLKTEILKRAFYALSVSGADFASSAAAGDASKGCEVAGDHSRLLETIPLFATLTAEERNTLLERKVRRVYERGAVVARRGAVMGALVIVSRGVLVTWEADGADMVESARLTPGLYFGEMGLLTGQPLGGDVSALTQAVTYEFSKESLISILTARPAFADELGETLELRQEARRNVLDHHRTVPSEDSTIAHRLADTIRHLFFPHPN